MEHLIPKQVSYVTVTLKNKGYKAYLVGGCVRDLIMNRKPKDWDITTNATPEQIIPLFEKTVYENTFGTVAVIHETEEDPALRTMEVTPFRLEGDYSDNRHPDSVTFSQNIEDDLKRRDFTINAIACDKAIYIDPFNGQKDIKDRIIRTVGNPTDRFQEDGLRLLRAIRFSCQLGFMINTETAEAIKNKATLLKNISNERIRDEFIKIVMSDSPIDGLILAHKLGLLAFIIPELEEGEGVDQTKAHAYTVFEHSLRTFQYSADKKFPLELRLAALFHDIGKPRTRRFSKEKGEWTFYGHDVVGARMTEVILNRLKFSKNVVGTVTKLVRWHMFFSDTEQITLSAVRRMIVNVGKDQIWNLMELRVCDRVGTGRPKENPYRLRKYKAMIEEALHDPLSVGMLKIDGNTLLKDLKMISGPKIGFILHALLEEVLENPILNTKKYLEDRAVKLYEMPLKEIELLGKKAKDKKELLEQEKVEEIRKKHWVK